MIERLILLLLMFVELRVLGDLYLFVSLTLLFSFLSMMGQSALKKERVRGTYDIRLSLRLKLELVDLIISFRLCSHADPESTRLDSLLDHRMLETYH